jgi:hypothetical protein
MSDIKNVMRLIWHDEKNLTVLGKTFTQITIKDTFCTFWKCPYKNNSCPLTKKSPKQVYQALYNGSSVCEYCNGNTLEGSIQHFAPENVKKYWYFDRNGSMGLFPESLPSKSNTKLYVKCDKHHWGIDEEQKQRCADLVDHIACPKCNGKQATTENNLKVKYPLVAKDLHPAFNSELILPYSSDKYPWWCDFCNDYYIKEVRLRTSQHHGCPIHHSLHKWSKTEGLLLQIFNKIIGDFGKRRLSNLKWQSGHEVEIDLYNPLLKIAIEFDGHQHKDQVRSDQTKNDMFYNYEAISLFLRIREKGLPLLNYHENQFGIECSKHEGSYSFLIPSIQKALQIINKKCNLSIRIYLVEELTNMIKELLPLVSGNAVPLLDGQSFGKYAPGLLRYLGSENRDPHTVLKGSNHVFNNVTCPNCGNTFSNHKSKAKILIKSKGLCNKCLHYVEDIHKKDSPLIRWYPEVPLPKSLEGKDPLLAKYYSIRNPIPASKVSYKGSNHVTFWNCPYCFGEYESTNYVQMTNGCKCKCCGKRAF